jgi:hypothetical protein
VSSSEESAEKDFPPTSLDAFERMLWRAESDDQHSSARLAAVEGRLRSLRLRAGWRMAKVY